MAKSLVSCFFLTHGVVSALLRGNWQDFNWHDALRGPSAIAELFVAVWRPIVTLCDFDYSIYFTTLCVCFVFFSPLSWIMCVLVGLSRIISWFYLLFLAYGQLSVLCSLTAQLSVNCYCLWLLIAGANTMNENTWSQMHILLTVYCKRSLLLLLSTNLSRSLR